MESDIILINSNPLNSKVENSAFLKDFVEDPKLKLLKRDHSNLIISCQTDSKCADYDEVLSNNDFEEIENLSFRSINVKDMKNEISEKDEKQEEEPQISCKCKNTKCLRLHCSCFKNLGYCSKWCKCEDCLNKEDYKVAREFVIEKTKIIYKNAFIEKITNFNGFDINKEGCNCTKNCDSKYCGCRRFSVFCSPLCKCDSCLNNKLDFDKNQILDQFKPALRKKHKIIFDLNTSENNQKNTNIIFEVYKKSKTF